MGCLRRSQSICCIGRTTFIARNLLTIYAPATQHVFCLCFNVMWWIDLWLWLRAKQTTTLSGLLQFF